MPLTPGTRLGPYEIVAPLGAGGMGRGLQLTRMSPRCIYTAMIRTQLFLPEAIHARLRSLARRQGRTVSDLVREALARAFGHGSLDERERTLKGLEGLWRGRKDIGGARAYVRGLRRSTRRLKSPRA